MFKNIKAFLAIQHNTESRPRHGAHAFEICYQALRVALAPELGGQWYKDMLEQSELCNWWTRGIDSILLEQASWTGKRGERLHAALQAGPIAAAHMGQLGRSR